MARRSGGKIVTDGLVLALDGADITSFRGEPTVNVVTNTNLDTGWSKGYQTNIVFNEIDPPVGIDSPVVGHDRGNSSGYWYSYGNYAPQVPNTIYTVSMYVKTLDSNFRIRFYTADNSETGRVWGSLIQVPNDGKWHRIVWNSFTNPSNSQSDSLSFNFYYAGEIGSPTTRTWFCAPQMEAKSYATPFVIGTRGATVATGGGWADLSGNTNHGELVNGVGYDSGNGGSLTFDGVGGYISIPNSVELQLTTNQSHTLEYMLYMDVLPSGFYATLMKGSFATSYGHLIINTTYKLLVYLDGDSGVEHTSTYAFEAQKWTHVVTTFESGTSKIYINGELDSTRIDLSLTTNTDNLFIGIHAGSNYHLNGKISNAKVYNRALTAEEISQNFNATRGRFGI